MSLVPSGKSKNSRPVASRNSAKTAVLAAIDIGTTKVSCFVGKREFGKSGGALPVRVTGIGHQLSHGLRGGLPAIASWWQNARSCFSS